MPFAPLVACLACASTTSNTPRMQPSPDSNPDSAAAAAMAPSQPIQEEWMATAPPPQTTTQMQRARVETMLEASQTTPSSEQLLSEGPGIYRALLAIFNDPRAPLPARQKALASMANIDDARGIATLRDVLFEPTSAPPFLRTAVKALARAKGARAVSDVAGALSREDPTVRIAAAEALGEIGGPAARMALSKQLETEGDPAVRAALERALAKATP